MEATPDAIEDGEQGLEERAKVQSNLRSVNNGPTTEARSRTKSANTKDYNEDLHDEADARASTRSVRDNSGSE